jgi:hypothetical protein
MGMFRRALIVVAALALSGCWLQPGYGPDRQNSNPFEQSLTPANVGRLQQAWSAPIEPGSQPLVTLSAVYTGFADTRTGHDVLTIQAVSRTTGAALWQRDLPLFSLIPVGSIRSVADGQVLTARMDASGSAVFEALDPDTGATLTTVSEPDVIDPATIAVGSTVVAYRATDPAGPTYQLVVRKRDTLAVAWTASIAPYTRGAVGQVLLHDGLFYLDDGTAASGAPTIHGFPVGGCGSPTCSPTWSAEVPSPATGARLLAITDDGHLLVHRMSNDPGHLNDLVALRSDGSTDWQIPLADLQGVATAGDTVFVVGAETIGGNGTLSARSGSTTWRAEGVLSSGTPSVAGGLAYVELDRPGGTAVAVFGAAGCGAATCPPVKVLDAGPGGGSLYGISITAGTVFVAKAGNPGGQIIAYAPTG